VPTICIPAQNISKLLATNNGEFCTGLKVVDEVLKNALK
jgi:hypothetical protein